MADDQEALKQKLVDFASDFPFFNLLGFEILDFGPAWSKTRITFRQDLANPNGVMHGGMIATLIDAGITQAMLMTDQYQTLRETRGMMTTVDLRVKYLRPLTEGAMTCQADIPRLGRKLCHANAVVTNDSGKEIAIGDSIILLMPGEARPKRQT